MHDRCVITESSLVVPQRHPFQAASISTLRESCGAGSCDHASRRYFAPKPVVIEVGGTRPRPGSKTLAAASRAPHNNAHRYRIPSTMHLVVVGRGVLVLTLDGGERVCEGRNSKDWG